MYAWWHEDSAIIFFIDCTGVMLWGQFGFKHDFTDFCYRAVVRRCCPALDMCFNRFQFTSLGTVLKLSMTRFALPWVKKKIEMQLHWQTKQVTCSILYLNKNGSVGQHPQSTKAPCTKLTKYQPPRGHVPLSNNVIRKLGKLYSTCKHFWRKQDGGKILPRYLKTVL